MKYHSLILVDPSVQEVDREHHIMEDLADWLDQQRELVDHQDRSAFLVRSSDEDKQYEQGQRREIEN